VTLHVVLPYTNLHPETEAAVKATGHPYDTADVSGDDRAYFRLFCDLWEAGDSFAFVEHDVLIRPDSLDELEKCPSPWCAFEVDYVHHRPQVGLGCVKFSAELIAAVPNAMERVEWVGLEKQLPKNLMWDELHPPGHWCRLDAWLQQWVLPTAGMSQCVHRPPLGHLRQAVGPIGTSHGCGATASLVIISPPNPPAVTLAALFSLEEPKQGLNYGLTMLGAGPLAIKGFRDTSEWRRLILWDVRLVLAEPKTMVQHEAHTEPLVVSVDPDGRPSFGLVSISREVIDEWPDVPRPLEGEDVQRFCQQIVAQGYQGIVDPSIRVSPSPLVQPNRRERRARARSKR
jgi:hypothetical protein